MHELDELWCLGSLIEEAGWFLIRVSDLRRDECYRNRNGGTMNWGTLLKDFKDKVGLADATAGEASRDLLPPPSPPSPSSSSSHAASPQHDLTLLSPTRYILLITRQWVKAVFSEHHYPWFLRAEYHHFLGNIFL